jgi:hypothetical protein
MRSVGVSIATRVSSTDALPRAFKDQVPSCEERLDQEPARANGAVRRGQ